MLLSAMLIRGIFGHILPRVIEGFQWIGVANPGTLAGQLQRRAQIASSALFELGVYVIAKCTGTGREQKKEG